MYLINHSIMRDFCKILSYKEDEHRKTYHLLKLRRRLKVFRDMCIVVSQPF